MAAQDEVDVCESWEDMDEIGVSLIARAPAAVTFFGSRCGPVVYVQDCMFQLDQKIKLMSSEPAPVSPALKGCKVNVIVEENACIGSQCVMPEPTIRILKRPTNSPGGPLNGESRARPVKTLEQRQKEYEEARLRILGEARSPEDVIDDK